MKLTPEQLQTLSRHLDELMDLGKVECEERLRVLSECEPELAGRLAELLSREAEGEESFMATLPKLSLGPLVERAGRGGECVGPYELLEELGHGGMSTVWLARRADGSLSRPVALKLPHAGIHGRQFAERFARERDILAPLTHENIARLYDAGVSENGQSYLAMEYVKGTPICAYCDAERLTIDERLKLFLQTCSAVQFAHSQLVIHRDLKPSNILVTASGHVMLLDFGIAKLLTGGVAAETELTLHGGRAMTVSYASPEQIAGQPMGTASDIYSLGVLLFEMLVGRLPYLAKRDTRAAMEEAILNSDITLPSQADIADEAAASRSLSLPALRSTLREELDGIVLKALQLRREDRYGTVDALADDVARYMRGLPVSPCAPRRWYRWRKFWQRNRLSISVATGMLLLIIAGAATIAWEAVRERQQAIRADREAAHQRATKDFLVSIFKASDPRIESDRPSGSITAKELLEVSAARIDQEFSQDPLTRIDLLGLTGDIFRELGEDKQAAVQLQSQLQAARRQYGPDHPIVIAALLQQASDATDRGDLKAANGLLTQSDAAIRRQGLENSELRARWWYAKSATLLTDAASRSQMEQALRNSIGLFESLGVNDTTYSNALSDLANVYFAEPDFPMAVEYNRRAVEALERQPRGSEGDLVQIYGNLGSSLTYAGDFEQAQHIYSKATELAARTYGSNHRYYWVAAARYAQTLHLVGDYRRATQLFDALVPTLPTAATGYRSSGDEHETAVANEAFGVCLLADGRAARAIGYLEAADRQYSEAPQYFYERDHLHSLLAQALDEIGRRPEAERMQREAIEAYEKHFASDNAALLRQYEFRAEASVRHHQWADAERDYLTVIGRSHDPHSFVVALSEAGLSEVAYARGDVQSALSHSDNAMKLWAVVQGYRDVRMGSYITRVRAQALFLSGDVAAALVLAERAQAEDQRIDAPESPEWRAAANLAKAIRTAAKTS